MYKEKEADKDELQNKKGVEELDFSLNDAWVELD